MIERNSEWSYERARAYVEETARFGSVLGLDSIRELLKRLDTPQNKVKVIHVAGTNGKGSVCTYIASILMEAGYFVGRYVSPTLSDYRERIQVGGSYIQRGHYKRHVERISRVAEEMQRDGFSHPTQFEIETAVAFLEFAEADCDFVVLEVGLGGREDATNVVERVACSVITSISMDHMAELGDTLPKIAKEKAGIIKKGIPVVLQAQSSEVMEVIEETAKAHASYLQIADAKRATERTFSLEGTSFHYTGTDDSSLIINTKLLGVNQIENIVTAIETVALLDKSGFVVSKDAILRGIKRADWPGRFSLLAKEPFVVVDGAHNEGAATALMESTRLYFKGRRIIRILGVFKDKEYEKILQRTVLKEDTVITITPPGPRGLDKEILAKGARNLCREVYPKSSVREALDFAYSLAGSEDVILVYGSLSFLDQVYSYFDERKG